MRTCIAHVALACALICSLGLGLTSCINYESSATNSASSELTETYDPPVRGTVYFRSDVLGKAGGLPTAVLTDSMDGAKVSLFGEVVELSSEAIILIHGENKRQLWIPRENVLAVALDTPEVQ